MGRAATLLARAAGARAALWVLAATTIANALGYGYQVLMARLLVPEDYAILTALFAILILEQLSAQVIQSATARLVARYLALGDEPALHVFVRRWLRRILLGAGLPALVIVAAAPFLAALLGLRTLDVVLLGAALFVTAPLTFAGGLLQGAARFGWFGWYFIVQAFARLVVGVALVLAGAGVTGAFVGAVVALVVAVALAAIPLRPLLRAARGAVHAAELGAQETRFFVLASVIMLGYAALTNLDAIASRAILAPADAGAYAGTVTMAKVVLFAPIAMGFILLERTARAHARGEGTDRGLWLAIGVVLATSGPVAIGYAIAPGFFSRLVVGDQYPQAALLIGPYALAALLNALLSLWIAHFIGRGELRFGLVLAAAVVAEIGAIVLTVHDAAALVRVVLSVAAAAQAAAVLTYVWERRRR